MKTFKELLVEAQSDDEATRLEAQAEITKRLDKIEAFDK